MPIFSIRASGRVTVSGGQRCNGRQSEELRRRGRVGRQGRHDVELHDLAGRSGIGQVEVHTRDAAAEGLVRAEVAQDVLSRRDVREVHDDVGALGEAHQDRVACGGDVHGRGEEAALVADLPDLDAWDLREVQDQEP